jgi:iron complex outermembrane receptor protein
MTELESRSSSTANVVEGFSGRFNVLLDRAGLPTANRAAAVATLSPRDFVTGFGTITTGINANYLLSFDTWVNESSPSISILNTVSNPPDFRARGQIRWTSNLWSLSASINYVDNYIDNQLPPWSRVRSWTTLDLSVAYSFASESAWTRGLKLRANVLNVADKAPPRIRDFGGAYGDPGYDTQNANPLGRFIGFEISKAW